MTLDKSITDQRTALAVGKFSFLTPVSKMRLDVKVLRDREFGGGDGLHL